MAWSTKQSLQGSDHNAHSHLNKQANKLNASNLHAQHSTNAQYTKYMHLGTILQGQSDST